MSIFNKKCSLGTITFSTDCLIRADILNREHFKNFSVLNCPMRVMKHFRVLALLILLGSSCSVAVVHSNITQTSNLQKFSKPESHGLSNLWVLQSMLGVVGVGLNSMVLIIFVGERQTMATSVNSMIW